jgi:hypothetical protein
VAAGPVGARRAAVDRRRRSRSAPIRWRAVSRGGWSACAPASISSAKATSPRA